MIIGLVPAAGKSQRMGADKLLLPVAGRALIEHVLFAAQSSAIDETVVVVRNESTKLISLLKNWDVRVLRLAKPTADMRETVAAGLEFAAATWQPKNLEAFVLMPADQAHIKPETIDALINAFRRPSNSGLIVVPTARGRRGHPTLFAWELVQDVGNIPSGRGLDFLLELYAGKVRECAIDDDHVLSDIDTPTDYKDVSK